jgi:hypothetical protein
MTDAFENLFDILHESIVENRFTQFDVTKMTLTLSGLSTSLAFLIHGTDTESQVVGTLIKIINTSCDRPPTLIETTFGNFSNRPCFLDYKINLQALPC